MVNNKYQFQSFLQYKGIAHGISSKVFGSVKKNATNVDREKLALFAKSIGITGDIVCMRQIHSANVRVITDNLELRWPETDSLITNKKSLPLAVLTADCLPVLFYDPKKEIIAAAHAGYKGLLHHVLENTIERFINDFKSNPKDIIVGIGPSIERDCYEVGRERIEEFEKTFPEFKNMFTEKSFGKLGIKKFYLDLRNIARQCLIKEGILKKNIEVMEICTKCDTNFYSYRRGDTVERFVSVISIA